MNKTGRLIGFDRFPKVLGRFFGVPWAVTSDKFAEMETALRTRIITGAGTGYEAVSEPRRMSGASFQRAGDVAVITIAGVVTQRPDLFASGGTSCAEIGASIDAAVADPEVQKIMLHIDSPGGSVFGVEQLSDAIAAAKRQKPVTAVADSLAASAAYWLGSQASEFVVTTGGQVGSIGVFSARVDVTRHDEREGIVTRFVHAGAYKVEGHPEVPMTDGELADVQKRVNAYYATFIGHVARGRGVTPSVVERDFGQGRMFLGADAVRAGLVDRVATADDVLRGLMAGGSSKRPTRRAPAAAGGGEQRELRAVAALAASAGVAIPVATDPAEAREQFRAAVAAKLDRDASVPPKRPALATVPCAPLSKNAVRLAAYRAERGLPTN